MCIMESVNVINCRFPSLMCDLLKSTVISTFVRKSHVCTICDCNFSMHFIPYFGNMSLMTILAMMVMGPGLTDNLVYLVREKNYFLKFLLIVFVDCQVMESQNPVVVSVEYFQSEYFPAQKRF